MDKDLTVDDSSSADSAGGSRSRRPLRWFRPIVLLNQNSRDWRKGELILVKWEGGRPLETGLQACQESDESTVY